MLLHPVLPHDESWKLNMKSIYPFRLSSAPVEKGQPVSTLCSSLKELEVRGLLSLFFWRLLGDRAEKVVCFFCY